MILQNFPNGLFPNVPDSIRTSIKDVPKQFVDGSELIANKLTNWFNMVVYMLPNFLLSLLVLIFFFFVYRFCAKYLLKLLNRFSKNQAVNAVTANFIGGIVFLIGLSIALNVLGLDKAVASMLAGAGLVGLAIGFAFQDLIINFISGVMIAFKQPFNLGDLIESNGYFGIVQKMTFRSTMIENSEGKWVIIPNRAMLENPIINYSYTGKRRIEINLEVGYEEDLEKVKKITLDTIKKVKALNKNKPIDLIFNEFGDSGIGFTIRFWIQFGRSQVDFLNAKSEAIMRIHKAFQKHHITIPYPQRAIHFNASEHHPLVNQKISS